MFGYESGLEIWVGLQKFKVIFLPVNATRYCPFLDQRIICPRKTHNFWRRVQYMIDKHTVDRDPNKTIHVLKGVQWGILV
jgi:hypothetical protein